MLYNYPRRYDDYSQLKPIKNLFYGEQVTVIGTIQTVHTRPIRGGKASIVEIIISDGTGGLRLSFFNQPWMANRYRPGDAISVSGRIDQYLGRLLMNNPDIESVEIENLNTNRIVPVYSLTERITQKWLRKLMKQVGEYWAPNVVDALPASVRSSARLMPLSEALLQVHFPDSQEKLRAARERLGFDEVIMARREDLALAKGTYAYVQNQDTCKITVLVGTVHQTQAQQGIGTDGAVRPPKREGHRLLA